MASRAGKPNKKKQEFRDALLRYMKRKKVDPHYYMVDLLTDESTVTILSESGKAYEVPAVSKKLKFEAAKELAQYLQPKLRAVELSTEDGQPLVEVIVGWEQLPHHGDVSK